MSEEYIRTSDRQMQDTVRHTNELLNKWYKYIQEQRCIENDWNNKGKRLTLFIDPKTECEFHMLDCGPLNLRHIMSDGKAVNTLFGQIVDIMIVVHQEGRYYDHLTHV